MNSNLRTIIRTIFPYFLLTTLIVFPLFGKLNTMPLRIWDETRIALNAYEMHKNSNWIVTNFEGAPDMWNTKPPLLIWIQVFFIRLIGLGELALRIPSALAAFFTCVLLLAFSVKYLKNYIFGFITVMVLVTCNGYINMHVTRSCDYDAMLTFFMTLSALLFFIYLEKKQQKHVYFFFITLSLGVLTKGISGLLFIPALILYAQWQKQLWSILKNKHFYGGVSIFIAMVFGYYLLREHYNPGYIKAVQLNEWGGRYLTVIENHKEDFLFYYDNLIDYRIPDWYLLIPCGLIIGFLSKEERIRKLTIFTALLLGTYFLIISAAQTKLEWYDAPLFPFIALLVALVINTVFKALQTVNYFKNQFTYNVFPYLFLFIVLITPYRKIIRKVYKSNELPKDVAFYRMSYVLKEAVKTPYIMDNYSLVYQNINPTHLIFYEKMLQEKSSNFLIKEFNNISVGDSVIINEPKIKDALLSQYDVKIIHNDHTITKYQLIGKKNF